MYVSSYSTYINTNNSQRVQKEGNRPEVEGKSSFASKLLTPATKPLSSFSSLPVNYISNYKVLNNQQRLEESYTKQNTQKLKFSKIKAMDGAKNAYTENTKMFSFLIKPSATLNQTPKVDKRMPENSQEAKEKIMRHEMVNTYLANDNYYKITA